MTSQDFEIVRNRTTKFVATCTSGGSAWNLTGKGLKFGLKYRHEDSDSEALAIKTLSSGIVATDLAGGLATITLDPTDTDDISAAEAKKLAWDLVGYDGNDRWPLARGWVRVLPDVVHNLT